MLRLAHLYLTAPRDDADVFRRYGNDWRPSRGIAQRSRKRCSMTASPPRCGVAICARCTAPRRSSKRWRCPRPGVLARAHGECGGLHGGRRRGLRAVASKSAGSSAISRRFPPGRPSGRRCRDPAHGEQGRANDATRRRAHGADAGQVRRPGAPAVEGDAELDATRDLLDLAYRSRLRGSSAARTACPLASSVGGAAAPSYTFTIDFRTAPERVD